MPPDLTDQASEALSLGPQKYAGIVEARVSNEDIAIGSAVCCPKGHMYEVLDILADGNCLCQRAGVTTHVLIDPSLLVHVSITLFDIRHIFKRP